MAFLYGDEYPHWKNAFRVAATRLAICYPIAAAVSLSVSDVFSILILLFWFLAGHWNERFTFIKRSPLVLASIPFVALTFFGVFYDYIIANDYWVFLESLRYWWGHYPLFFSFILSTLLFKKETRSLMFSSINLAIVLIWILVFLFGTNLLPESYRLVHVEKLNIYRNTICFGMGLVLWTGLWICVPFTSKDIPLIRRFLPVPLLLGMKRAAKMSPIDLLFSQRHRFHLPTIFFSLLRWGIVGFVCYYLFWINPSRTAQIAFLAGISIPIICWHWKKGSLIAIILCFSIIISAHYHSPIFERKASRTFTDIKTFIMDILHDTDTCQFGDRLGIWKEIMPSICEKPILGYGMELGRKEIKAITGFVDPHNEFINVTLEFGLVGLCCFLFWLAFLLFRTGIQRFQWKCFGFFIIVTLVIDCMNNCALSYNRESSLFCILIAIMFVIDKNKYSLTADSNLKNRNILQ